MTLKEITYRIYNHIVGGRGVNNDFISIRQLEFDVHNLRSLLVRRWLESEWRPQDYEQELTLTLALDTTQAGIDYMINQIAINQESDIYKSSTLLPKRVSIKNKPELTFVGYGFKSLDLIPVERLPYVAHEKWTGKKIRCSVINDTLYVIHPKTDEAILTQNAIDKVTLGIDEYNLIEAPSLTITVRAIFENPTVVTTYLDSDYPCSSDMVDQIIEQLIKRYTVQYQNPSDKVINDDKQ